MGSADNHSSHRWVGGKGFVLAQKCCVGSGFSVAFLEGRVELLAGLAGNRENGKQYDEGQERDQ